MVFVETDKVINYTLAYYFLPMVVGYTNEDG